MVRPKIIYGIGVAVLISCNIAKDTALAKFPNKKQSSFTMQIPKGYVFKGQEGDSEDENLYIYPDSSMLFITDFTNSPNYDILVKEKLYYTKFAANVLSNDTLFLEGVSKDKHWRDITYGRKICIGYSNVSKVKKPQFDQALKSFRAK